VLRLDCRDYLRKYPEIEEFSRLAVWVLHEFQADRKSQKSKKKASRHGAPLFIFNLVCCVTRPVIELRFETCLAVWRGICTPTGRRPRFRSSAVKSFLVEMLHFVKLSGCGNERNFCSMVRCIIIDGTVNIGRGTFIPVLRTGIV